MNEIMIFNNPEFGEVRTVIIDGEPWFVGIDVARALGYPMDDDVINTKVPAVDSDLVEVVDSTGQIQQMKVINELGVYDLVFGSYRLSARGFMRWVISEVLPCTQRRQFCEERKRKSVSTDR